MKINKKIDELSDDIIKSTQELVKIRSIEEEGKQGMPFGENVGEALEKALAISKNLGFKTVNMDGYIGYAEYGEGEDYVAILGHLDVVPEGDGWIYPPYDAEIHNGKLYGRGTMDDKGPIVAALYGLKAIKDLGLQLSKRVRIIFGTNEETGCKDIPYYMNREKAPISGFTPDAEYPIIYAEKGLTTFDVIKDLNVKYNEDFTIKYIRGGHRANMVPDYCEAGITGGKIDMLIDRVKSFAQGTKLDLKAENKGDMVTIKSLGISAHGSLPELGKNAIMQMLNFLDTLPIGNCDIAEYISLFNKNVGFETDGKSFGVGLEDKVSGKLTFNVGTINMDENKICMSLNLRYPVTFKFRELMEPFKDKLKGTNIRIENMEHKEPLYFPSDHYIIKALQKVYAEQTGVEAKLLAIGGGTYAKEMPNIVAFGPLFPEEPDVVHQPNEYIKLEHLILNSKIYAHAIYELAK